MPIYDLGITTSSWCRGIIGIRNITSVRYSSSEKELLTGSNSDQPQASRPTQAPLTRENLSQIPIASTLTHYEYCQQNFETVALGIPNTEQDASLFCREWDAMFQGVATVTDHCCPYREKWRWCESSSLISCNSSEKRKIRPTLWLTEARRGHNEWYNSASGRCVMLLLVRPAVRGFDEQMSRHRGNV